MMLKKQTVWLLTMLSLIIVLSVYYMSSPGPSPSDGLAIPADQQEQGNDQKKNNEQDPSKDNGKKDDQKGTATTNVASDEAFVAAENDMTRARSRLVAEYTAVVASDTATAKEQTQAQEKIDQLQQLSATETMLESLIVAKGYDDALVNAQGGEVNVIVKADQLSNEQVVDIMNLVSSRINDARVAVSFNPNKN